jgi:hypothetical protein
MEVRMAEKKLSEKAVIAAAGGAAADGYKFLCMGPMCWGAGKTPEEAVKNAKKNRVKIYEGKRGWCFILYLAQDDAVIDDMGSICYVPKENVIPYTRIGSYNMPPKAA